jgi:hypothetical protein
MKNQIRSNKNFNLNGKNDDLIDYLEKFPFVTIIGKYDHVLGPRALYSPIEHGNDDFIKDLLRDALNTKNKFVILNHDYFYTQICKVKIKDKNARGRKQLYAIILLRHIEKPLIPSIHFKKIEMLFRKLGNSKILEDDMKIFKGFSQEIQNTYLNKDELIPLESANLKVRSGVNTIQGFCELIKEQKNKNNELSDEIVIEYVDLMLDSCSEIIKALEDSFQSTFKG